MAKSKDSGKLKDSGNDVFDLKKFVSHYPSNIAILKQINQAIESFSEYDKMILRFARLLGVLYNSGIVDPTQVY